MQTEEYRAIRDRGKGKEDHVRVRVRGDTFESLKSLTSSQTLIKSVTANRQAPAVAQLYAAHLLSRSMISIPRGQDYRWEIHTTRYTSHHWGTVGP